MAWFYLFLGGVLEIIWLIAMKYSNGFKNFWPSAIVVVALIASMFVVSLAIRTIPMGTAYAIWTGIGAAGGAIAGIVLFNESKDWLRLLSIALIIAGIVGLKLTAPADQPPAGETVNATPAPTSAPVKG
jgi:quaternary ammonium compound-resistance protein SugE